MTCLHATEPASVHLAAWARSGATRDEVDAALYLDRTVVKQLAMRRTVFGFPRELLPAVWGSASARVAGQQVRQLAKEVERAGITGDGPRWADEHLDLVRSLIERDGPLTTSEVRERLPALDARITRGKDAYQVDVAIAGQVITALAASGAIVRGTNDGGWKLSRPRWTDAAAWRRPTMSGRRTNGTNRDFDGALTWGLLLADVRHPQDMRGPRCCSGSSYIAVSRTPIHVSWRRAS